MAIFHLKKPPIPEIFLQLCPLSRLFFSETSTILKKLISLFEQLEQGVIPASWQQKVPSELTRQQITIRIELLNEMGSPESDDAVRLSEQVTLLQEKVNGAALDNETLLKQWLSKGEIDSESLALLARIKPAFV